MNLDKVEEHDLILNERDPKAKDINQRRGSMQLERMQNCCSSYMPGKTFFIFLNFALVSEIIGYQIYFFKIAYGPFAKYNDWVVVNHQQNPDPSAYD